MSFLPGLALVEPNIEECGVIFVAPEDVEAIHRITPHSRVAKKTGAGARGANRADLLPLFLHSAQERVESKAQPSPLMMLSWLSRQDTHLNTSQQTLFDTFCGWAFDVVVVTDTCTGKTDALERRRQGS